MQDRKTIAMLALGAVVSGFFACLSKRRMRRRGTGDRIERLRLSNARFGAIACVVGMIFLLLRGCE